MAPPCFWLMNRTLLTRWLAAGQAVDLQLSGHSHGGQVRFPLLGAVYLPPMARKYPYGLNQIGRLKVYTNRGLGTTLLPARFGCPPDRLPAGVRARLPRRAPQSQRQTRNRGQRGAPPERASEIALRASGNFSRIGIIIVVVGSACWS